MDAERQFRRKNLRKQNEIPEKQYIFGRRDDLGLYTGFCLTSNCTVKDFSELYPKYIFTDNRCYSQDTENKIKLEGYITIFIIVSLLAVMVLSTAYEISMIIRKRDPGKSSLFVFSALRNAEKIFATSNNSNHILCIHGIKTITMLWIIFLHAYLNSLVGPFSNYYDVLKFIRTKGNANVFSINFSQYIFHFWEEF
ncbi:hypothetical protein JTB14_032403 [Gonioctena quinquepunctata]|nr:hypothetical protein JTB14_032403 [Gonioctena quinquepunctata]